MVCMGKRPILLPQAKYVAWQKEKSLELKTQGIGLVESITKIKLTFYAPDKRVADLTNKAESIMDLLVDNGILQDDNWFVCGNIELVFGGVDKDNARVEIEIV